MDPGAPRRVWLLRDLRRVEWRRLLLAIALLSAWGRALLPLPAAAISPSAEPLLCSAGAATSGTDGAQAEASRACPFCRLADVPADLVPPEPEAMPSPGPACALGPTPAGAAPPAGAFSSALARGPPGIATTH
jgi:hypothetical protein